MNILSLRSRKQIAVFSFLNISDNVKQYYHFYDENTGVVVVVNESDEPVFRYTASLEVQLINKDSDYSVDDIFDNDVITGTIIGNIQIGQKYWLFRPLVGIKETLLSNKHVHEPNSLIDFEVSLSKYCLKYIIK